MKRVFAFLLAVVMLTSLAACGDTAAVTGAGSYAFHDYTVTLNEDGTFTLELGENTYTGASWEWKETYFVTGVVDGDAPTNYWFNTDSSCMWVLGEDNTVTPMNYNPARGDADTAGESTEAATQDGVYLCQYEGAFGTETLEFDLNSDGSCLFFLPDSEMITDVYGGTYTRDGDTVTVSALRNVDTTSSYTVPGLWGFIDAATGDCVITVDDAAMTFTVAEDASGEADGGVSNVISGIAYASNSTAQQLDLYLPEGESIGTLVVLHGGGFKFGSQTMPIIQPIIEAGLANGYAVAAVDYRKSGEAVFPAAVADAKASVRWLRANGEQFGLNTDNLVIWGESAGAYLALMTALTPEVEALNGDVEDNLEYSSAVAKLVTFYAPVEFWTMDAEAEALGHAANFGTDTSFESAFVGQNLSLDEAFTYRTYWGSYTDQLPADFSLRAWIQVGDSDNSVPYTQSVNFAERLTALLGEDSVSFQIIQGADHEDDLFYTAENLAAIFAYLAD